jgi:hypothetical protein
MLGWNMLDGETGAEDLIDGERQNAAHDLAASSD